MTTVVLMGPPGAGKGTHAELLAGKLGVPVVSTGDIFRAQVAAGTELGRTAQGYLDAGEYVPDEVTNAMVCDRLAADDARPGFLLDGYPRTLDQAAVLDKLLTDQGRVLDAAVVLLVDQEDLVRRLLHRAKIEHRSDDTEDVIRRRLQVYADQTVPLVSLYGERDLLHEVDGTGDVAEVRERILAVACAIQP
ncbi:adenylate kinase [Kribbella antiqua]|uniref:Adenylate kinase n=1 Tax=Kribbella antiqua TaxID=2512217 RepID=A0A4R2ITV3_9ACTN|nr:adenylate kinase [Kribbella antiqua]TCO48507.1 adenylate kinase [Kribbella antiqua]